MKDQEGREVAVALGSNLGNRLAFLQKARDLLRELSSGGFQQSKIYLSEPLNCPNGASFFFNATVCFQYNGTPESLLQQLKKIETQLGRGEKKEWNAPREIDLDILYFNDLCINEPNLIVPHPRMQEREFVLRPLSEISGSVVLPHIQKTVKDCLADIEPQNLKLEKKKW